MVFIPSVQGWFDISKSINVIQHIYKLKKKNHIILSIDYKKAYGIIQYPFMIKTLSKLGIEKNLWNLIKNIYKIPTANVIFIGETLSGEEQGKDVLFLPLLFNIILKVLASAKR